MQTTADLRALSIHETDTPTPTPTTPVCIAIADLTQDTDVDIANNNNNNNINNNAAAADNNNNNNHCDYLDSPAVMVEENVITHAPSATVQSNYLSVEEQIRQKEASANNFHNTTAATAATTTLTIPPVVVRKLFADSEVQVEDRKRYPLDDESN